MASQKLFEQLGSALKTAKTGLINTQQAATPTPAATPTATPATAQTTSTAPGATQLAPDPQQYTAETYTPEKYKATNAQTTEWKVDSPQLVEDRIKGIVGENGLLMQQAETQGKQQAARSGLLNSSMAVGAAQGAVLDKALPIAQQDANTMAAAGQFNAGEKNSMSKFNADVSNQAGQFNAAAGNEAGKFNAASGNDASRFNAETVNKTNSDNATLKEQGRQFDAGIISDEKLANLDVETKKWLTENENGKEFWSNWQKTVNDIIHSDMPDKDAALDLAWTATTDGMALYSGIDSLGLDAILGADGNDAIAQYDTNSDLQKRQNTWDEQKGIAEQLRSEGGVRGELGDKMLAQLGPRPT